MSESAFWIAAHPVLQALRLDPVRVENILHRGWPDVSYTHGIIELKDLAAWPAREKTDVHLGFKIGQVPCLMRRWDQGGLSWVLARVGGSWFLFDGWSSRRVEDGLCRADFKLASAWSREARKPWSEASRRRLLGWLTADEDLLMPHDRAKMHRLRSCKTAEQCARELGWNLSDLLDAEAGSGLTDDLLAAWEN